MSVTISYRSLVTFVAGVTATVIAMFVFQAVSADAAPGDSDATFVAITPCRLMDTRPGDDRVGTDETFGAGDTKTISAHGTNGKCTIPPDAVGLSLNVTALGATTPSFLTIWPDGTLPKASSLNPAPGQPPTPNAVTTTLSGAGSFNVFNKAGSVDVIVDVNGFYTDTSLNDLDKRLGALETAGAPADVLARLDALEAKTAAMSIEDAGSTIRFTGVDVQIVDGSGDTRCSDQFDEFEACNGSGNLIVGYNEDPTDDTLRSGSHNIVTGIGNDYQSNSGVIAGNNNTTSGEFATVLGGTTNVASAVNSSVSGGFNNTASGVGAVVSGGRFNIAGEFNSSVSGGERNTASGESSSVSGGNQNTASAQYSSVSGGERNTADGLYSSVSGGDDNTAVGLNSSVSGGVGNIASFFAASVSGGRDNTASDTAASVSGGNNNIASGESSMVSGGDGGEAGGDFAVVVGGSQNSAGGPRAVVVGGGTNTASGSKAVVSGGSGRSSTGTFDWRAGALFEDS